MSIFGPAISLSGAWDAARTSALGDYPIEKFQQDHADLCGYETLATNPRQVIQAAWDWCGAQNVPLPAGQRVTMTLAAGRYLIDGQLNIVSHMQFRASSDARIEGAFTSSGSNGLVGNSAWSDAVSGIDRPAQVVITGGSWGKVGTTSGIYGVSSWNGNIFSTVCDDMTLTNVVVDIFGGTSGGRAYYLIGDRITMRGCEFWHPPDSAGTGGIRYGGGKTFLCEGARGISGDDCLIFGPSDGRTIDIEDAHFRNCQVQSTKARMICASVREPTTGLAQASAIRRVSFVNIASLGPSAACIALTNQVGTGGFRDILVQDVTFEGRDMGDSSVVYAITFEHRNVSPGDSVPIPPARNIVLRDISLKSVNRSVLSIYADCSGLLVDGLTVDGAPRHPNQNLVRVLGAQDWELRGLDLTVHPDTNIVGAYAVQLETSSGSAGIPYGLINGRITRSILRGVPDGIYAVSARKIDGLKLDGVNVTPKVGATTAKAWRFYSDSERCYAYHSDLRAMPASPILNDAGAVIDASVALPP